MSKNIDHPKYGHLPRCPKDPNKLCDYKTLQQENKTMEDTFKFATNTFFDGETTVREAKRIFKDMMSFEDDLIELEEKLEALQQENKQLNDMYKIRLKESIEQDQKLEAIYKACPCLVCSSFVIAHGCVDWKCDLTEKQFPMAINFALKVLGE